MVWLPVCFLGGTVTFSLLALGPLWSWFNFSNRFERSRLKLLIKRLGEFISKLAKDTFLKQVTARLKPLEVVSQLEAGEYLAWKVLGLLAGTLLGLSFGVWGALVLGCMGFLAVDLVLKARLGKFKCAFAAEFPFAVDLLALVVSSGTGLIPALEEVALSMPPGPLRGELWRVLGHMMLGASFDEALEEFARRSGLDEVQSFVAALVQAQQLGTELEGVLAVLVAGIRERERQEAEERSQLLPIKMLVPLLFFIFPALLILLFAPFIVSGYLIF